MVVHIINSQFRFCKEVVKMSLHVWLYTASKLLTCHFVQLLKSLPFSIPDDNYAGKGKKMASRKVRHNGACKCSFSENCVYNLVSWKRILEYKASFSTQKTKVLAKGWTSHDLMRMSEGMSGLTSLLHFYWCNIHPALAILLWRTVTLYRHLFLRLSFKVNIPWTHLPSKVSGNFRASGHRDS